MKITIQLFLLFLMILIPILSANAQWDTRNYEDHNLPDPDGGVETVIGNFMKWILRLVGGLAIIAFAISGIQYMTAAGDQGQIDTAKRNLKYSIIGMVVSLIGLTVVYEIFAILTGMVCFDIGPITFCLW